MTAQWLTSWWNLIFLLPFALALLYLGLYVVSGITFGDADVDADVDLDADADIDADADADVDHDFDADHEVDADHDIDADHDVDSDHDADAEGDADHEAPALLTAMNWLGVGRVPLSIVLMVLFIVWGASGMLCNSVLIERGAAAALLSIPLAAAISLLATHFIASLIDRYFPLCDTSARRRHALLGLTGEAIFRIDDHFGMVSVRDDQGDLYQMPCRLEAGCEAIPKGATVQLIAYNAKQGFFFVKPVGADETANRLGGVR